MERKLINYYPYAVREFTEIQGLVTEEQPEFELAWEAQEEVFANQFVDTALDYGLSRWEKMLKIFPKGTDTLDSRRLLIKTKLMAQSPYTMCWLKATLDELCGLNNHSEQLTDYHLKVQLRTSEFLNSGELAIKLNEILPEIIPGNLVYSFDIQVNIQEKLFLGGTFNSIIHIPIPEL